MKEFQPVDHYRLQALLTSDLLAHKGGASARVAVFDVTHEALSSQIQKSLNQRTINMLRTASLFTIPILIAFVCLIPFWREGSENWAWEQINNYRSGQTREAVELLTQGCWEKREWNWMPDYLATLLFGSCDLKYANLSDSNLSGANLRDAELSGVDLSGADLSGADLSGADLSGANLVGANLSGADLSGADLTIADLTIANLTSANLTSANLSGADLSCLDYGGNLRCADFRGAKNLTPEQVKSAKNWQQAKYDQDFRQKLDLKK